MSEGGGGLSLRLVIGRAGSGKSRFCLDEIDARLEKEPDGSPLVYLVPEQMTQAADRAFIARRGGTVRAQSLSFRRLAFRVMQEVGGAARLHIDETGQKMLLLKLARERQEQLRAFRRMTSSPGWIEAIHEWLAECKRYCVEPKRLAELSAGASPALSPLLRDKLHDVSLLYERMEQELAGKYVDSEDYLALLAEHIPQSAYMRGASVWIDGFHGFTPSELAVVRQLMKHAAEVNVTLCLDRDYAEMEEPDELELFHPTAVTLLALKRAAQEEGIRLQRPVLLSDGLSIPPRYAAAPRLAALERAFVLRERGERTSREEAAGVDEPSPVTLCAAANQRSEAEAAAREIVRLVALGEVRWRDIAVFVREWEAYAEVLSAAFADHGIPHFMDQKRSVLHHPLCELIRSSLETVETRWSYDAVFRAVKTELLVPADAYSSRTEARYALDKLENYVLQYGIRGTRWTDGKLWKVRSGIALEHAPEEAASTERERKEEQALAAARELVAGPLKRLDDRLKRSKTMREQAEALYRLLEECGVPRTLELWRETAELEGLPERAREHDQLWDRVMDMLDQLVELVGDESADAELFASMVAAGLESIRMGLVPPAIDQVLVGSLDRTRTFGVKRLFLLGVNDGVIPKRPKEGGVISEHERESLLDGGLSIAPDSGRRLLDERFLLYNAVALPSEGLWVSYAMSDPEGAPLLPSEWIRKLKELSPGAVERTAAGEAGSNGGAEEALERVTRPERAAAELLPQLRRWTKGEPVSGVWWAVYNWLAARPYWRERLQALLPSLFHTYDEAPLSPSTSKRLYGDVVRTSVSRLETFAACPYSHFAAYGLKLEERPLYRLEAPDIGQLYHASLSLLAKRLAEEGRAWSDLGEEECRELAHTAVDELAPRLLAEILFSSNRHRYITRKLKEVVGRSAAVIREQAVRSGYRQLASELAFGSNEPIPPLSFELPDGTVMELSGRIDRIDSVEGAEGYYVRVVDYKSRAHRLRLGDVYYGLSLQLLAYLDAAAAHAKAWLGEEAVPAGALYFHVHRALLARANAETPEAVRADLFKAYKMRGLLLDEPEAARQMDTGTEQGHSAVVPLYWKKDGTLSKNASTADAEQWKALRRFVRNKMTELGASIREGDVRAAPFRRKAEKACTFCRYRPVCGFDPEVDGYAYRSLAPLREADAWERIVSEEER